MDIMAVKATRDWVKIDNRYVLFVKIESRVFTKEFEASKTMTENVIETNKKIKENDIAELIKKELGVSVEFI